jgi:ABC-type amino acid transport substrate-binding protein
MQLTRLLKLSRQHFSMTTLGFTLLALMPLLQAEVKQAAPNTLARVQQTGTLKLGYYANARPFSYQDDAGKPAGYAIAVCQQVANDLKNELGIPNLSVDFIVVTAADRFEAVKQGKIDLLCGPSVPIVARRKEISYSIPVFPAGLGAMLRADAPAQLRDALTGREAPYRPLWRGSIGLALQKRTFSAVSGTTGLNWLSSKIDQFKIDAKVLPVYSHEEGVQKVLDRSTDVLFGERSILLDAKKRNASGDDLIVIDRVFTYEPVAFALTRGDEDFRLFVDRSLSKLSQSGAIQSLYKSFFGEPDENTLTFFRLSTVPE